MSAGGLVFSPGAERVAVPHRPLSEVRVWRKFKFGAACGVRCGSGYLSTLICKPKGPLLAGNIVQVRLERKALSAAVSPTCCSGREQRSKTAYTGGAISFR